MVNTLSRISSFQTFWSRTFVCLFWCGPFLKLIEFVTILLLLLMFWVGFFFFFFFWPWGMWNLGSLMRDQTCTPCLGRWSLNHWTAQEVPRSYKLRIPSCWGKTNWELRLTFVCVGYIYLYLLLSLFSCYVMSDSLATPYTVAHQAPLSMGFSFSRGSSQPRDWTCIPCIAGRVFTTESPEKPCLYLPYKN